MVNLIFNAVLDAFSTFKTFPKMCINIFSTRQIQCVNIDEDIKGKKQHEQHEKSKINHHGYPPFLI